MRNSDRNYLSLRSLNTLKSVIFYYYILTCGRWVQWYLESGKLSPDGQLDIIPITEEATKLREIKRRRDNIIDELKGLAKLFSTEELDLEAKIPEIFEQYQLEKNMYVDAGSKRFRDAIASHGARLGFGRIGKRFNWSDLKRRYGTKLSFAPVGNGHVVLYRDCAPRTGFANRGGVYPIYKIQQQVKTKQRIEFYESAERIAKNNNF